MISTYTPFTQSAAGGASAPTFVREIRYPITYYTSSVGLAAADLDALVPSDANPAPGLAVGFDIFLCGSGGSGASNDTPSGSDGGLPGFTRVVRVWRADIAADDTIFLLVGAGGLGNAGSDGLGGDLSEIQIVGGDGQPKRDEFVFGGSGGASNTSDGLASYLFSVAAGATYSNPSLQPYGTSNPRGPGLGGSAIGGGQSGGASYGATANSAPGGYAGVSAPDIDPTIALESAGGGGGGSITGPGGNGSFGGGGGGSVAAYPGGNGGNGFISVQPFAWRQQS